MKELIYLIRLLLIISPSLCNTSVPDLLETSHPSDSESNAAHLKIYKMDITSTITNRYSYTTVVSKIKNTAKTSAETTFAVVLPDKAFISSFIMEINYVNYTATVQEKEEAANVYQQAVESGASSAYITTRDSNYFSVSVNIEAEAKAAFYLTYEELLTRKNGMYEQVINIYPKQYVDALNVAVVIKENRKITHLKAPPIRSGNEIFNNNSDLDPRADLNIVDDTTATVRFSPNLERQKQVAQILNGTDEGFGGQFIVQYDVERDSKGGEVLVKEGYFAHFFAPSELEPFPKHVVFVLDRSSSMRGQKIEQLKEAMSKILRQLREKDLFSIIVFGNFINVLDLDNANSNEVYPSIAKKISGYCFSALTDIHYDGLDKYKFPTPFLANKENIEKAQEIIYNLQASGGTDILSALYVGLHMVELKNQNKDDINRKSIMVFLSDGDPTVRNLWTGDIEQKITNLNTHSNKVPITTLSFGEEANKNFLQKLAYENFGFFRHIYEAGDASLQLQDFYKQISSPLLTDVVFNYTLLDKSHTKNLFPLYFEGSELVVVGLSDQKDLESATVIGNGIHGSVNLKPTISSPVLSIERLWAYMTIKQLLENDKTFGNDDLRKKVVDLAFKYSFVTPLTSLVVVKPNEKENIDIFRGKGTSFETTTQAVIRTTPFCIELYRPTTEKPDLLKELTWLSGELDGNGFINLPNVYQEKLKLGLNHTLTEHQNCPKTPLDTHGKCKLLYDCSSIWSHLTDINKFSKYACIIENEYAGICCPEEDK